MVIRRFASLFSFRNDIGHCFRLTRARVADGVAVLRVRRIGPELRLRLYGVLKYLRANIEPLPNCFHDLLSQNEVENARTYEKFKYANIEITNLVSDTPVSFVGRPSDGVSGSSGRDYQLRSHLS